MRSAAADISVLYLPEGADFTALRPELERIAQKHGALIQVVELPPGPPVLATLTAEVTGGAGQTYDELVAASRKLARFMAEEQGVVDVDASYQAESKQLTFVVDQEKAALHGVSKAQIAQVLGMSLHGHDVTAPKAQSAQACGQIVNGKGKF